MKYLKLIQHTVFVLVIISAMELSGQIAISCNGDIIPENRILQDDINLNGINFEAYAESEKVRNACGGANGIRLVFSTRFQGTTAPINATIYLTSNDINYQFVSNTGLQNVSIQNGEFLGDFVFSNQEDGCAEILLALPEVNHFGDEQFKRYILQSLNVIIQNHTTSNSTNNSFGLYDDQIFENYYHFYDDISVSTYLSIFDNGLFVNAPTFNYFHKNFTIDEDFNLFAGFSSGDPEFTQYFDVNSKITVQDGAVLDIIGNHLSACPTKDWTGIEVLEGGKLEFEKSWGSKAKIFIKSNNNSELRIFDSRIFNSDLGLVIKGSTQLTNFTNNRLEDLNTGVYLAGNATNISLVPLDISKPNLFKNIAQTGVYSSSATNCEIMFNKFENIASTSPLGSSNAAIRSENSSLLIAKNEIRNCSKGAYSIADKVYIVSDNEFVDNTLGAKIRNNKAQCNLLSNTITGKNGISYFYSSPQIHENYINNDGNYPTESFGIQGNYSTSASIRDNNIQSSDASGSVVLNNSTASVSSNDIALLSQNTIAGVLLNGGDGSIVTGNVIEAADSPGTESFGIVSSASGANEVSCNDIFQLEEAIVVKDNSMDIDMKTNNLFSLGTGIKLEHSIIGEQVHNGNLFLGPFSTADIFAIEMEDNETSGSKFRVDGAENPLFVPLVVAANGDLVDEENTPQLSNSCIDVLYTTSKKDRLVSICNVINSIKYNDNIDPLRKKHILLFYYNLISKYFPDKTHWPDCIRLFMHEFVGTNIEKMGNVNEKMRAILAHHSTAFSLQDSFNSTLSIYLHEVRDGILNAQSKTNFQQTSAALSSTITYRELEVAELWDEMTHILETFFPEDDYETLWLELHSIWVKSFKDEELTEAEMSRLEYIASLCPLLYGDLVHGARALVSDWGGTRFEMSSCPLESENRARKMLDFSHVTIHPNPTTNNISIDFNERSAKITIHDVSGKRLLEASAVKGEAIDVSNLLSGLYFITVLESSGKNTTEKFIKL